MRFERLGLDDGLSQQAVLAIAQDSPGFMWFGTEDGLDRYDGYSFQHVRQARLPGRGLPANFVTDVQLDAAGRLWVGTDGGGVVWRDATRGDFHSLTFPDAHGFEYVRAMRFDSSGRLWIGSRNDGLAVFDPVRGRLERFRDNKADPGGLGNNAIFALTLDRAGTLWVGTQTGLDRLDTGTFARRVQDVGPFKHVTLQPGDAVRVRALAADAAGILWIGTDVGLLRLDPATGAQHQYRHEAGNPRSLPSDRVQALHVDNQQRLWIGTADGLALLDRDNDAFDNYRNDPADPASPITTS
jgi:ligand-binding sensor domain-containing protein